MRDNKIRAIACATDAGGAANIAPVYARLDNESRVGLISSKYTNKIFSDYGCDSNLFNNVPDEIELGLFFQQRNPNVILTGTSRYESIERKLISIAKERGIPSIVILDEWFNYSMRFENRNNNTFTFPDMICCPDEMAFQEAIDDGLPKNLLSITGSPALSELWNKREKFKLAAPDLPEFFDNIQKPIVLFLSETHASDYGVDDNGGPLGEFLGYTEKTVLRDLFICLNNINRSCSVVEKLHPADDLTKNQSNIFQNQKKIQHLRVTKTPLHNLLWHSDIVVGMRSMALLEASLLGKPTISYQPGLRPTYGMCTAERLGLTQRIKAIDKLENWIAINAFKDNKNTILNGFVCKKRPAFATEDAVNNIIKLLLKFVH